MDGDGNGSDDNGRGSPNRSTGPTGPPADPMVYLMTMIAEQQQQLIRLQERQQERDSEPPREFSRSSQTPFGFSTKEPRVNNPDEFDGRQPDKLRRFITQCEIVFQTQPSRYPTENICISYMISYLRGFALDAVRPFLTQAAPLELSSKAAFIKYLEDNFGDPDKKGTARRKLKGLRQTGTAAEYFAHFRELIAVLGWVDQEPIVDRAIEGLSPDLKDELARCHQELATLDELSRFVVPLDNRIRVRRQERERETAARSQVSQNIRPNPTMVPARPQTWLGNVVPQNQPQFQAPPQAFPAPRPMGQMNDGRRGQMPPPNFGMRPQVSEAERQRRLQGALCYRCGQQGHMANNCSGVPGPLPPHTGPSHPKA